MNLSIAEALNNGHNPVCLRPYLVRKRRRRRKDIRLCNSSRPRKRYRQESVVAPFGLAGNSKESFTVRPSEMDKKIKKKPNEKKKSPNSEGAPRSLCKQVLFSRRFPNAPTGKNLRIFKIQRRVCFVRYRSSVTRDEVQLYHHVGHARVSLH